jgi:hypothetical protein
MKTNILISMIAVVAMAMVSCQSYESISFSGHSSEKTERTAESIERDGFILKMVKPGDTLWEYSQKIWGVGYRWEEILSENPQLTGRLDYDKSTGMWVVIIYPGEIVRIGGKEISPSFSSRSDTTTTISSSYKNEKGMSVAWWTWVIPSLLIALVTGAIAWLRYATRFSRARERAERQRARLIEEAMISNHGKKIHISWTENSFEVR